MKKILLIIAITFFIFQMVVLATDIDIGPGAVYRASDLGVWTAIDRNNPANESGKITSVEIWANVELINCEVAIFYDTGSGYYTTRSDVAIGTVTAGSKQTFPVDLTVEAGDVIGIYYTGGKIGYNNVGYGGGFTYKSGDHIPCNNEQFVNILSTHMLALYGTGTTEVEEEANVIFFGTNF